jgi:hypothetical protein
MATVTEMRRVLREHGEDVPARGRLNADDIAKYEKLTDDPDWDTSGDDALADPDELEPSVPMQAEKPPRTARSDRRDRRARPAAEQVRGWRKRKPADPKTRKRKQPRVSVDHLVSRAWEGIARIAQPLSLPLSRCLQVQSPVAGMILEEIVAGTLVDRALQPVARAEEKAEKVLALVGPPLLVLAIEQSFVLPPEQMMMRQALLMPMLKESLRMWLRIAGPKVEEAARREAKEYETFGRTIDEMVTLFFGQATASAEQVPDPEMAGAAA